MSVLFSHLDGCLVRCGFLPPRLVWDLSGVSVFAVSGWVLAEWPGNAIVDRPNEGS